MDEIAAADGKVITIPDPACGTGGMLSVAQYKMQALNAAARAIPFGQELNPETYAACCSDETPTAESFRAAALMKMVFRDRPSTIFNPPSGNTRIHRSG